MIGLIYYSSFYNKLKANDNLSHICSMIYNRIYQATPSVKTWYKTCINLKPISNKPKSKAQQLNHNFSQLNISHLYILTPAESKWAWQGLKKQGKQWVEVDESPKVIKTKQGDTVLQIKSFRGVYFESKKWLRVVNQLKDVKELYIDLRSNLGGNFVAMLRVLSSFYCSEVYVGKLVNSNNGTDVVNLKNQLDESIHSDLMMDKKEVILKSFKGYGCLKPKLHILVNKDTGSTSEILAESLQEQLNARVYGPGTRGGVVLGMNYQIDFWPEGYTLSIPEALYVNPRGQSLEGVGLLMDQIEYPIDIDLL